MTEIVARLQQDLSQLDSAFERLRRFIELHLEMVAEQPHLAEVLTVELRQSAKFMREYKATKFLEYLDILSDLIRYGQSNEEISKTIDPQLTRRVIFGALDEVSLYWVSKGNQISIEEVTENVWQVCAGRLFTPHKNP